MQSFSYGYCICIYLSLLNVSSHDNMRFWLSPLSVRAPHDWQGEKNFSPCCVTVLPPLLQTGSSTSSPGSPSFPAAGAPESLLSFPLQLQPPSHQPPTALRIFRCPLKDEPLRPARAYTFSVQSDQTVQHISPCLSPPLSSWTSCE